MTMTGQNTTAEVPAGPRPRHRAAWGCVACLTAIVLIVPVLWGAAVWALRHTQESASVYHRPISLLRVNLPAGQVTVLAGRPGRVSIGKLVRWEFSRRPAVREVWHGHTLTISVASCTGGGLASHRRCDVGLSIGVPATVSVVAIAAEGQISVRGVSGAVRVQVGSGDVHLARVTGQVRIRVGSGSASAVALGARQVHAAVRSGTLRLLFARPPRRVTASAGTGTVTVLVPAGRRYRVAATTGPGGSRQVSQDLVSGSSPRLITLSAGTGTVRLAASCCQAPRPASLPGRRKAGFAG